MDEGTRLKLKPYVFVLLVVVSLLAFYTAYDKQTGALSYDKLAKVISFQDASHSLKELNKVAALAAIGLVSVALVLGPLTRLFPKTFCPYMFFRKPVGLAGFAFAAAHSAFSLYDYYKLDVARMLYDNPKIIGFVAAVLSLAVLLAMSVTSTRSAVERMGYPKWKALQTLGYAALLLAVVHFYVLEYSPSAGFSVRPYGMLFFWLAIAAIALRLYVQWKGMPQKTSYEEHLSCPVPPKTPEPAAPKG